MSCNSRIEEQSHQDYWSSRRLYVVLLPSASRKLGEVRLGVGKPDGEIRFERLDARVPV